MSAGIEATGEPRRGKFMGEQQRSFVCGAILASVAFLEASINEFFDDDPELSNDVRVKLGSLWEIEFFRRHGKILEKYQTALRLAGRKPLPAGENPYQDARHLVKLRNELVHFIPTDAQTAASPGVQVPLDEFGKALLGKFQENPWPNLITCDVYNNGVKCESGPETPPFFPERCLGSGCACWAAKTALAFADEFHSRIGLKGHYDYLRPQLSLEQPEEENR